MKIATFTVLLAAGAAYASAASAQTAPPPEAYSFPPSLMNVSTHSDPGWDGDAWRRPMGPELVRGNEMQIGVAALKNSKFALAEDMFGDFLRRKPNSADANFYMGVAKMNLGEWADAKTHLEFAAIRKPTHPDPKSRLGVTYAKLGDVASASGQRADLMKMAETCKAGCKLSPYIAAGIEMIDEALAEIAASSPKG